MFNYFAQSDLSEGFGCLATTITGLRLDDRVFVWVMRKIREESLVATTNALSAFVVDSCTGAGKPTMNAESAFIVASNAVRFPSISPGSPSLSSRSRRSRL